MVPEVTLLRLNSCIIIVLGSKSTCNHRLLLVKYKFDEKNTQRDYECISSRKRGNIAEVVRRAVLLLQSVTLHLP